MLSPDQSLEALSPTPSPGGSIRPSFQALAFRAASKRRSSAMNWDAALAAVAASAAASAVGAAALDEEEDVEDSGAEANAISPSGSVKSAESAPKKMSGIGALFAKGAAELNAEPLSPQQSITSSRHRATPLRSVAELEEIGNVMDEDLSDSSESEGSVSQDSDARLIQERFDMGRRTMSEGAEAVSAFTSFLMHHHEADDVDDLKLSPIVAHRWRWFVYSLVHLRFADCAEQQTVALHRHGHYPMATELALADDTKPGGHSSSSSDSTNGSVDVGPVPGDRPTRRASLFGSVIGTYHSGIQEGHVSLVHCLGDDVADVSQALRVRKSKTMHRVQKPPLYFDDMPGHTQEPRRLPAGGKDAAGVGGLLAALQKHSTRKLEAAIAEAQAKLVAKSHSSLLSMASDHGGSSNDLLSEGSPKKSPTKRPSMVSIAVEKRDTMHTQNKKHQKRMTMLSNDLQAVMEAQHAAHMALVMEEQRQHKLKDMMDRVHETAEFHMPRPRDLFSMLRFQYDPEGLAHPANQFYTPANLLRREAVRCGLFHMYTSIGSSHYLLVALSRLEAPLVSLIFVQRLFFL